MDSHAFDRVLNPNGDDLEGSRSIESSDSGTCRQEPRYQQLATLPIDWLRGILTEPNTYRGRSPGKALDKRLESGRRRTLPELLPRRSPEGDL